MNLKTALLSGVSLTEEIEIIWYHLYMESKKYVLMNLFTNRNRVTDIEHKLMVPKGETGGRDKLEKIEIDIYTPLSIK